MTLEQTIRALDDARAEAILDAYARAQPPATAPARLDPLLRDALASVFDLAAPQEPQPDAAELARAALIVLSEDPAHREGIAALIANPPPRKFTGVVESALLITAVLTLLQTRIAFDRRPDGSWSLKLEKQATKSAVLKELVQKLLAFR